MRPPPFTSATLCTNRAISPDHYYGRVTLRQALAKSMNSAAVNLAEQVGYGRVAEIAKRAGLNDGLRATPANWEPREALEDAQEHIRCLPMKGFV